MKTRSLLERFSKDKRGSISIHFGLVFTMLIGATIGSIEIGRIQKARSILQDRLDATVLYLGNSEYITAPQEAGETYFRNTVGLTDLDIASLVPTFEYDDVTGAVNANVTFKLRSLLSGGLVPERNLSLEAMAVPRTSGTVEIAMVLDVSGSMNWSFESEDNAAVGERRIDGLFEAAEGMFDVIDQNPTASPSVAVIPYATSVDITDLVAATSQDERIAGYKVHDTGLLGNNASNLRLDDVGMLNNGPTLLSVTSDDVTERDHTNTMAIYPAERFVRKNNNGYQVSLKAPNSNHPLPIYTETRSGLYSFNIGTRKVTFYRDQFGISRPRLGGYERPYMGVLPMTKNIDDVRNYVKGFEPSGGTAGHIGAAWGLYALSPQWADVFDHPAGEPQRFKDTTEKYLVIMTDGQFNSQKTEGMTTEDMYSYFQSVCARARGRGIRVFTVGLLVDANTDSQLSQCSGDTGSYYPADDRLQLIDAFRSIGRETGELRLSS